jgi:hypothetical protein
MQQLFMLQKEGCEEPGKIQFGMLGIRVKG